MPGDALRSLLRARTAQARVFSYRVHVRLDDALDLGVLGSMTRGTRWTVQAAVTSGEIPPGRHTERHTFTAEVGDRRASDAVELIDWNPHDPLPDGTRRVVYEHRVTWRPGPDNPRKGTR